MGLVLNMFNDDVHGDKWRWHRGIRNDNQKYVKKSQNNGINGMKSMVIPWKSMGANGYYTTVIPIEWSRIAIRIAILIKYWQDPDGIYSVI